MKTLKELVTIYHTLNTQIIKFLLIGGFTFSIDYLCMMILIEFVNINYLIGTATGFVIGSIINYLLSIKWVFISGKFKNIETEFLMFMFFTLLGLGLNHIIMYSGCAFFEIDYRIVKFLSLIIVTIFSFITKKTFVFIR